MINKLRSPVSTFEQRTLSTSNQNNQLVSIWAGLVMDGQAKHYQRMKNAIWLFLYLLFNSNRSGFLTRKLKDISSDTGIKKDTILSWLNILRRHRYIATRNTGRGLLIQIKALENPFSDVGENPHQNKHIPNSCNWQNPTSEMAFKTTNELNFSRKPANPNDISINKYILNNDIDSKDSSTSKLRASKKLEGKGQNLRLAMELADALNDQQNIALYISYSKKYAASFLRKVLDEVKQIPSRKIKKSRGALFNYLVQKYAKEASQNLSH